MVSMVTHRRTRVRGLGFFVDVVTKFQTLRFVSGVADTIADQTSRHSAINSTGCEAEGVHGNGPDLTVRSTDNESCLTIGPQAC